MHSRTTINRIPITSPRLGYAGGHLMTVSHPPSRCLHAIRRAIWTLRGGPSQLRKLVRVSPALGFACGNATARSSLPIRDVASWPILLQKSFWGADSKFLEPLMRLAPRDVRDLIISRQNAARTIAVAKLPKTRCLRDFWRRWLTVRPGISTASVVGRSLYELPAVISEQ
jgi:hypothetical protein